MPTSIPSRAKVGLGSAAALDACGKPMCIEALEAYPVDWPVSGDRHLYDTLKACCETSTSVDLVWGSAYGWTDPWSRARRLRIVSLGPWSVVVASDDQQWDLPRQDIQAVRPATDVFDGDDFNRQSEFPPSDV